MDRKAWIAKTEEFLKRMESAGYDAGNGSGAGMGNGTGRGNGTGTGNAARASRRKTRRQHRAVTDTTKPVGMGTGKRLRRNRTTLPHGAVGRTRQWAKDWLKEGE